MAETNTQLIAKLTVGMDALTTAVAAMRDDMRDNTRQNTDILLKLQAFETSLQTVHEEIDHLLKLVRDGNGQPSLVLRASKVENDLTLIRTEVDKLGNKYDSIATARIMTRGQVVAGVVGMITTALLAFGAILAQLMKP